VLMAGLLLPGSSWGADQDFTRWLGGVRPEALAAGINPPPIHRALYRLAPLRRGIQLPPKRTGKTGTFPSYLRRGGDPQRRPAAREHFAENRKLLTEIGRRYGVQPRFIVALWGIETNFGRVTGNFPVIAALATLAYDGRRSAFFRKELINALRIVDLDHVD